LRKLRLLSSYPAAIRNKPHLALKYLLFDHETGNFTYAIANSTELTQAIASFFGVPFETVAGYIDELEKNDDLRNTLNSRLLPRHDRNPVALYGRRAGWYAIARIIKPSLVVETGVHDGLGSSVLLEALRRNGGEGRHGRLFGIDIDEHAGWLVPDKLAPLFTFIASSSLEALPALRSQGPIDLMIHDSDHRASYELAEYRAVASNLAPGALILSDNAHESDALADFSKEHQRRFFFWKEVPKGHFYPGAGIGMSALSEL